MSTVMQTPNQAGRARGWGLLALACAVALGIGSSARAADQIEDTLPAQAYKIVKYLKKNGYQNVGVLKFRVQKGNEPESFHVGPLNLAMATRLENILLLMNDKTNPIGIIHDAGRVAASKKEKATYMTPQGCDKLFKYQYPLVWGTKVVDADAFVTGVVKVNFVKRTTTVTIEAIDRKTKKLNEVTSFELRTDRSILTDVCTSFALSSQKIRTMSPNDADDEANKKGKTPDMNPGQPKDRLVDLEILYDSVRQEESPSETHKDAKQVPEPKENNTIVLRLKNNSDKRVAVLLAVNGKSTLYQEDLKQMSGEGGGTKWVIDPGKQYDILGYYRNDDKTVDPFKVLSDEETGKEEELESNEFLGAIHMLVFVEGETGGGGGDSMVKTQGLRKVLPLARLKPKTAKDAANLVANLKGSIKTAGIIKPAEDAKEASLTSVPFKDPKWQETRVIWYYSKKPKSGDN